MKKIMIFFVLALSLSAQTIQLTGQYTTSYINPFLGLFKKEKNIEIITEHKTIRASVKSNINDFQTDEFIPPKTLPVFTFQSADFGNLLQQYYGQTYNIVKKSRIVVFSKINWVHITLTYSKPASTMVRPDLSKIECETNFTILFKNGNKPLKELTFTSKMNSNEIKQKGENWNDTLQTTDSSINNLDNKIQEIIEKSIISKMIQKDGATL